MSRAGVDFAELIAVASETREWAKQRAQEETDPKRAASAREVAALCAEIVARLTKPRMKQPGAKRPTSKEKA